MSAKPTKYGLKVWMRADPSNGYCNDFQVCTGMDAFFQEKELGGREMKDLTQGFIGHNHIVN